MPEGQQINNFDLLRSRTDADLLGDNLCDQIVFKFDEYAPNAAGLGKDVGFGNGRFDFVEIYPGLHVVVSISEDGGQTYEPVATLNATGPVKVDFTEEGGAALTFNGHNLIFDPYDGGTPDVAFVKYARGHWTYEGDAENNAVEDLSGHGQIVDLADLFC